jgi:hypothetical protein
VPPVRHFQVTFDCAEPERVFQAGERAVDGEHERAGEVKREQHRRFGHDRQHAAPDGCSGSMPVTPCVKRVVAVDYWFAGRA